MWSGDVELPPANVMRDVIAQPRPRLDAHNALALTLAEELGVAPSPPTGRTSASPSSSDPCCRRATTSPARGASPDAGALFAEQVAASLRAPLDPTDFYALRAFGCDAAAARVAEASGAGVP